MKSTLPTVEAQRLADGTVILLRGSVAIRRFAPWRPDIPRRESRVVWIETTYHRIVWQPSTP